MGNSTPKPHSIAGDPGEDPEQVRKAVKIEADHLGDRLAGLVEGKHAALRPAGDGAGYTAAWTEP